MKGYEKKLLLDFLDTLSDYMGNEGCNDWWLLKSLTEEEKAEFMVDYNKLYGDDYDEPLTGDDCLMDHLALEVLQSKLR